MITEGNAPPNNPHVFGLDRFIPFFGVVENRDDPLYLGRCKVRIFGVHPENKELVTTEQLPWAFPIMPIVGNPGLGGTGHAAVGPVVGTHVVGFFADGYDRQQPFFFGVVSGGTGHFGYGGDQAASGPGADGNSAYGPQGEGGVSPPAGNFDPNKPLYTKGAEIAAAMLANPTFSGIKPVQACAAVGNLIYESAGLKLIREGGSKTPPPQSAYGIGNGWGLAQWTNTGPNKGRYTDFCNWASRNGKRLTDYDANVGFFLYELQTSFKRIIQVFKQGGLHSAPWHPKGPHDVDTIEGATRYFIGDYERPAEKYAQSSANERINHAKATLAALNKAGAPIRSTGTPVEKKKS
jgi:Phage tail lysozyme/Gp5 N-terminal OB domain